jgi:integration host factor subunit alpha
MTKAEIVQALYARVGGFSKKEAADLVDLVFEMMKETLGRGEKIKISGFGNFVLRDKRQRPGRNPQTGEVISISERRVLTFKASQILKHALNPRNGGAQANGAANGAQDGRPSVDAPRPAVAGGAAGGIGSTVSGPTVATAVAGGASGSALASGSIEASLGVTKV